MFFTLIPHPHLIIYSSDINPFLKKDFLSNLEEFRFCLVLNSYMGFCKSFVHIALLHFTVKLLEWGENIPGLPHQSLGCLAHSSVNACGMKKCMLRALCGGTRWETTGKDKKGETMSAFG